MGASRSRLLRQLLLESLGVSLLGGALGAVLAWAATDVVSRTVVARIPMMDQVGVDGSALLFGIGVAAITGLLVGLVPALRVTDGDEAGVLKAYSRGSSAGWGATRLREALVVGEVALAFGLLVVGGLLLRSFGAVLDVDLGFEAEDAVAWQLNPSRDFGSIGEMTSFFTSLTDRVRQVPGVQAVGLIDAMPLGRSRSWGFSIPGRPETDADGLSLYPHIVDRGYLRAMGIPLEAGRALDARDTEESAPVVMINAAAARRLFPGQDALGRFIQMWDERVWEIVGIVHDVHHLSPETAPGIQAYFSLAQMPDFRALDLVVRSTRPVEAAAAVVSAALAEVDPAMPTREHWTVRSTVDRSVAARRFTLGILSAFGAVALLLAALGIYGVLAQSVAERTPEIGIRMALGASAGDVVGSVMARTLFLTGVGVILGMGLALWGGRVVGSLLFGIVPTDPFTLAGMGALLLVVGAAAASIPAVRAARTRGAQALQVS
jgi:predicted permease